MTVLKQPYIVQELTSVLREWGVIWKHLYVVIITKIMLVLIVVLVYYVIVCIMKLCANNITHTILILIV